MFIFILLLLLLLLLISTEVKSYQLLLLLLGTDVKTSFRCYFILLFIDNFFILFHKISICTGVIMQRLDSFIEVQMLWPHCDVRITLSLYLLDLPMHRCYSAEAVIYLFSIWDGMQHSIPKVWQVVPSNISVQSRIVHSYVMASLTALAILQPSLPMILKFSTDVLVLKYWWWCFQMFFISFSKHSRWFPYVLIFTINPVTPKPVNHIALLFDAIFIF